MLIDFHTHCFPDAIAPRAMDILAKNAGNMEPFCDGTAGGLTRYLEENGIDKAVVLSIATNPKQQTKVNDFAASINRGRLIGFGSVYPAAPNALDELERIKKLGLRGIKFHPDYQDFFVDDPKFFPVYEKAAELGLITVFHSGVDLEFFEPVHCTPQRLALALPAFNGGVVVAAHMGGCGCLYETEQHLVGRDVYLDTSFSYGRVPAQHARRIILRHGADRILFASDMPWSGTNDELRFVDALGLNDEQYQAIVCDNAKKLLGM